MIKKRWFSKGNDSVYKLICLKSKFNTFTILLKLKPNCSQFWKKATDSLIILQCKPVFLIFSPNS